MPRKKRTDQTVPADQPHNKGLRGGRLLIGGTHVRTGRPPDAWKEAMRHLADRREIRDELLRVLNLGIKDDGRFEWALEYATKHGYGQPVQQQQVEVTQKTPFEVVHRVEGRRGE